MDTETMVRDLDGGAYEQSHGAVVPRARCNDATKTRSSPPRAKRQRGKHDVQRAPKARADTTANSRPFFSFDHLIRLVNYRLWNDQADLLRRLQVDDQLELHRLLYR